MTHAIHSVRDTAGDVSPKPHSGPVVACVLTAAMVWVAFASAASAQQPRIQRSFHAPAATLERTVFVSPVPGDPKASGERLLSAVSAIEPSPDDPWLVKVEPGLFDLGTKSLVLVPGLEVEGSGARVTVIQGLGQSLHGPLDRGRGVVIGADFAFLRDLSVRCVTDEAAYRGGCICIANVEASPELENLVLESRGFGNHWGIRNTAASPLIEEVEILLEGGTDNYGVVNARGSSPTILRSTITVRGGENLNAGLLDREGGAPALIEDTQIFALGGREAIGLFELSGGPFVWVTIDDAEIVASGAESNTGILGFQHGLDIQDSIIAGDFALDLAEGGVVDVTSTELEGGIVADVVSLGATRLSAGSAVEGISEATCAGVYVLSEPARFHADTCPGGGTAKLAVSPRRGLKSAARVPGGELG